jgi:hypothetical protein
MAGQQQVATMVATTAIPFLPPAVNLAPAPLSAAIAGAHSAWALPTISQWLGSDADTSFNYVIAFLLLVALPAHAGVLGMRRQEGPAVQGLDKPLLIRVGASLAAAAAVSGLLMLAS